jgi:indole-3-glycerol phosphate synthase
MTQVIPDILSRIVDHKRAELASRSGGVVHLEKQASESISTRRSFKAALTTGKPSIIAEIKKASPSKGLLSDDFNPARTASQYQSGGAAALSVLTDEKFFQGSLADLNAARQACNLPALRKDFTIDAFHVVEAAANGADAVLLIAAILTTTELRKFRELAATFNMDALVEVHDANELDAALESGAEIIGVNNRNLHTFEVTLQTSLDLAKRIPANKIKVSESGIHQLADIDQLVAAGYDAFLVGEHLMKAADPANAIRQLRGNK